MITPYDVAAFAAGGESETVEFKETTGQRQEAARTLSAMLNGQGGVVLFGVRPNGHRRCHEDSELETRSAHRTQPPADSRRHTSGERARLVGRSVQRSANHCMEHEGTNAGLREPLQAYIRVRHRPMKEDEDL